MIDESEDVQQLLQRIAEKNPDLVEFRLDEVHDLEIVQKIAQKKLHPAIAARKNASDPDVSRKLLIAAANSGFEYVDVDMASQDASHLFRSLKSSGSKVIASYHDRSGTPGSSDLTRVLDSERKFGADICKIITTATHPRDNLRVLNFVEEKSAEAQLVSFAMGSVGVPSRILCPFFGAKFTFAALSQDTKTAKGQLTIDDIRSVWQLLGIQ